MRLFARGNSNDDHWPTDLDDHWPTDHLDHGSGNHLDHGTPDFHDDRPANHDDRPADHGLHAKQYVHTLFFFPSRPPYFVRGGSLRCGRSCPPYCRHHR